MDARQLGAPHACSPAFMGRCRRFRANEPIADVVAKSEAEGRDLTFASKDTFALTSPTAFATSSPTASSGSEANPTRPPPRFPRPARVVSPQSARAGSARFGSVSEGGRDDSNDGGGCPVASAPRDSVKKTSRPSLTRGLGPYQRVDRAARGWTTDPATSSQDVPQGGVAASLGGTPERRRPRTTENQRQRTGTERANVSDGTAAPTRPWPYTSHSTIARPIATTG